MVDLLNLSPLLCSLRHFINNAGASQDHYDNLQAIELLNDPKSKFLSFDQVKRCIRFLSGVIPLEYDMCPSSCIAYTGPYSEIDKCPQCQTPWYHPSSSKPQKQFLTILIRPVIQAFYSLHKIAEKMHYLEWKLSENLETLRLNGGNHPVYDDTTCGSNLLNAWSKGCFGKYDITLQLSINGTQLHWDQASEAWVFIWIIHNLPPDICYKEVFVIPGMIVPGLLHFSFALLHAATLDCLLSSLPHLFTRAHVLLRYNLADAIPSYGVMSCTISIWRCNTIWPVLLYDTHLRATHTTTSSIRGVQIPIYLVSSTTDSLRWSAVVLKLYQ